MREFAGDRRLRAASMIISALAIVSMAYSVVVAATPLLGEEEFAGTTFANLQTTNPRLANVIWHDTTAVGTVVFGGSLATLILAWKGLSRGSKVAWYSLLVLTVTLLAALLVAHVPVGNTSFTHIGPGSILLGVGLVAVAVSAKPALSGEPSGSRMRNGRLRAGRIVVSLAGVAFMILSVGIAVTPLPGEEDYAGTTFAQLGASNPRLADVIWHDYTGFGLLLFGISFLIVLLAWRGIPRDATVSWYVLLVLSLTILAFLLLAHFPVGNTGLLHIGPPLVLAAILLSGVAVLSTTVLTREPGIRIEGH